MLALKSCNRLPSLTLALLLASCGSTRATAPGRVEELAHSVLIIQETPSGEVRHSWVSAAEIDLSQYDLLSGGDSLAEQIVFVSRRPRDCDKEHIDCYRGCKKRRLPSHLNHIPRGSGAHGEYCAKVCLDAYMECLDSQKVRMRPFPVVDKAVDWLKRHRKEVLVGTVVVIAGVAFVAVSAGAGLVVLAPVVLVASSGTVDEPWLCGVPI